MGRNVYWSHKEDLLADTGPDHYIERSVAVSWVGQCMTCRAVHLRGEVFLVDNQGTFPLSGSLQRPRSGLVQMATRCGRKVYSVAPDFRADTPEPMVRQIDECQGTVYQPPEPSQEALLSVYALGGPDAVISTLFRPHITRGFAR